MKGLWDVMRDLLIQLTIWGLKHLWADACLECATTILWVQVWTWSLMCWSISIFVCVCECVCVCLVCPSPGTPWRLLAVIFGGRPRKTVDVTLCCECTQWGSRRFSIITCGRCGGQHLLLQVGHGFGLPDLFRTCLLHLWFVTLLFSLANAYFNLMARYGKDVIRCGLWTFKLTSWRHFGLGDTSIAAMTAEGCTLSVACPVMAEWVKVEHLITLASKGKLTSARGKLTRMTCVDNRELLIPLIKEFGTSKQFSYRFQR